MSFHRKNFCSTVSIKKRDDFIEYISKYDFKLTGIGSHEFYIFLNNDENQDFTIQVSNFEFDNELNFG